MTLLALALVLAVAFAALPDAAEAAVSGSGFDAAADIVRIVLPAPDGEELEDLAAVLYRPVAWPGAGASAGQASGPAAATDGAAGASGQGALYYRNPLIPLAPDPDVLRASDGLYYLYPTGGSGFDVHVSRDLVHWTNRGRALQPSAVAWGGSRNFWAPSPLEYGGRYLLFYSAEGADGLKHISAAVSDSPLGPFRDYLEQPLFHFPYNTIDPHLLIDDDGSVYIYYVRTGYPAGGFHANVIFGAKLYPEVLDALVNGRPVDRARLFETAPRLLLKPDQPWEFDKGYINEAPFVLKRGDKYYMMYSANWFDVRSYGVGYAVADDPLGPFVKAAENPILAARIPGVSGPGHNAVVPSPDGSELFIVYHTHMDVDAPSGRRQVAIDRLGFDADGRMYVDGPTITPQPLPAGAALWRDIAGEAVIQRDGDRLILEWPEPRLIAGVALYQSAGSTDPEWTLVLDGAAPGGNAADGAAGGARIFARGEANRFAIVHLEPVRVKRLTVTGPQARVAVIGLPGMQTVSITVNGQAVYEGSEWPDRLFPPRSALRLGRNEIDVTFVDRQGRALHYAATFDRKPVEVSVPGGSPAAFVQGEFTADLRSALFPEELKEARVQLVPVVGGTAVLQDGERLAHTVFEGASLPGRIAIRSQAFADGPYDLVARVAASDGAVYEASVRVVIDNWETLEDEVLPPQTAGWFGTLDRMKTAFRSAGWAFAGGQPERWFGDASRIHRVGPSEEVLVWHLAGLQNFAFTLYALDPSAVRESLSIEVSGDQAEWTGVPYTLEVIERSDDGLLKLKASGTAPREPAPAYIAFRVRGDAAAPEALQLGRVELRAPKTP